MCVHRTVPFDVGLLALRKDACAAGIADARTITAFGWTLCSPGWAGALFHSFCHILLRVSELAGLLTLILTLLSQLGQKRNAFHCSK